MNINEIVDKISENIGASYFLNFWVNKKNSGFRLKPHSPNPKIKQIKLPPELKREHDEIEINHIINKDIKNIVNDFIVVLTSNFSKEYLTNFYNNISSIKIQEHNYKFRNFFHKVEFNGGYYAKNNSIKLSIKDKSYTALYHELFHMASSVFKNGTIYSGFRQHNNYNFKQDIGIGLNEGYTQVLTERFFGNIPETKYSYPFETHIAKLLEAIIGQDKMAKYYFNANLSGLVKELEKYSSYNNIINFITNLDLISKIQLLSPLHNLEPKLLVKALKEIIDFLFVTYNNMLKFQYNKGLISNDEYKLKLLIFSKYLKYIYYSKKYRYIIDNEITFYNDLPTLKINVDSIDINEKLDIQNNFVQKK